MKSLFGCGTEYGKIRKILLKHARDSFRAQEVISTQWDALGYSEAPDFFLAAAEYDRFARILEDFGIEILYLPQDSRTGIDSIYIRDCVLMTPSGAIILNMGKPLRRSEPEAAASFISSLGIPLQGKIQHPGTVEGGDIVFLDPTTLVVGHGYRTNGEGIRQLRELLKAGVDHFIVVPLPHWKGPGDVLHLMSFFSPIDRDLALVYSPLMPVPFRNWLQEAGITLVEVPDEDYETMGCNVLAVAPRQCLMLEGNPRTRERLCREGVRVTEFCGDEISKKGAGGPTCLTRPLLRD
jgi:arginine deiminase